MRRERIIPRDNKEAESLRIESLWTETNFGHFAGQVGEGVKVGGAPLAQEGN